MTRRIVWSAVFVLALLTLGGSWFVANFERVPVKEWTAPEAEARRNDYLALERFLARMGRPLQREGKPQLLDALPAGDVLILDRNRRRHMSQARVDKIMAWVDAGGYLILVPEFQRVSDPVLERLGARWYELAAANAAPNAATDDEEEDNSATDAKASAPPPSRGAGRATAAAKKPDWPKQISVFVPGSPRPLSVAFRLGLQAGKRQPDWSAGRPDLGDQFLHYSMGRGHVTVAVGLDGLLSNHQLGQNDHAELLWTLLETYQPKGGVLLMSRLAVPSLWEWLAESAPAASLSALVLLALWLWRRLLRFGPVIAEAEASRREISEHLAALGRYVWRAGGLAHWLTIAREQFHSRLAIRHPAIAEMSPAEQAAALAKMSDRPQSLIAAALFGPAESPNSFTAALRTLRNLERIL
jgi:hypothetical protein